MRNYFYSSLLLSPYYIYHTKKLSNRFQVIDVKNFLVFEIVIRIT
jgi:hypothetical protein